MTTEVIAPPAGTTRALPVAVDVDGPEGDRVRDWLDTVLGWQPVDRGTASLVPPAGALVGPRATAVVARPAVLLVPADCPGEAAARAAARLAPDAVLAWPDERERLADLVGALLAEDVTARPSAPVDLRVAGAAGGAGTTTVALAVAGLAAWSGQPTLLITAGRGPLPAGPTVTVDALGAPGTWDRAVAVAGVDGLRAVHAASPPDGATVLAEPAQVVVRDVGVSDEADVLVARRDGPGLSALDDAVAAVAVVVDEGPASRRAVRRACGQRRCVVVPHSTRVARAGLAGRVPADLPGSWLRLLRPLFPRPGPH